MTTTCSRTVTSATTAPAKASHSQIICKIHSVKKKRRGHSKQGTGSKLLKQCHPPSPSSDSLAHGSLGDVAGGDGGACRVTTDNRSSYKTQEEFSSAGSRIVRMHYLIGKDFDKSKEFHIRAGAFGALWMCRITSQRLRALALARRFRGDVREVTRQREGLAPSSRPSRQTKIKVEGVPCCISTSPVVSESRIRRCVGSPAPLLLPSPPPRLHLGYLSPISRLSLDSPPQPRGAAPPAPPACLPAPAGQRTCVVGMRRRRRAVAFGRCARVWRGWVWRGWAEWWGAAPVSAPRPRRRRVRPG